MVDAAVEHPLNLELGRNRAWAFEDGVSNRIGVRRRRPRLELRFCARQRDACACRDARACRRACAGIAPASAAASARSGRGACSRGDARRCASPAAPLCRRVRAGCSRGVRAGSRRRNGPSGPDGGSRFRLAPAAAPIPVAIAPKPKAPVAPPPPPLETALSTDPNPTLQPETFSSPPRPPIATRRSSRPAAGRPTSRRYGPAREGSPSRGCAGALRSKATSTPISRLTARRGGLGRRSDRGGEAFPVAHGSARDGRRRRRDAEGDQRSR